MEIKTKNEPWLILILTALLILSIALIPTNTIRIIIGLPFVLFFPGYTLITALFPKKEALDATERIALGFGMSIAVVGFTLFILNHTPWGIRLYPTLVSITLFMFITSVITWYRRRRLPDGERANVTFQIPLSLFSVLKQWNKVLLSILVILILGGIGAIICIATIPRTGEQYTEFYILGSEQKAGNYPSEMVLGDTGVVLVIIVNHEKTRTNYQIETRLDGDTNGKTGLIVLDDEQKWEESIHFIPNKVADNQKVEFLLYKDGESEPLESLFIWLNVTE